MENSKKGLTPKKQAPKSNLEKTDAKTVMGVSVEELKKKVAEDVKANANIKPEETDTFMEMLQEAMMPVTMTDEEFELGSKELDIRSLSKKNTTQMLFRTLVLQNVYLKQLLTASIDQIRLLMVLADKMGVENISKATDEVVLKEKKKNNIKTPAELEKAEEETKEDNKA